MQFFSWGFVVQGNLQLRTTALAIDNRGMTGLVSFSESSHIVVQRMDCSKETGGKETSSEALGPNEAR